MVPFIEMGKMLRNRGHWVALHWLVYKWKTLNMT